MTRLDYRQAGGIFARCNNRSLMVVLVGAMIGYSRVGGRLLETMLRYVVSRDRKCPLLLALIIIDALS